MLERMKAFFRGGALAPVSTTWAPRQIPSVLAKKPSSITPKIFISYRRNDSAGYTGRIADRLVGRFGEACVFIDVDAIPLGSDFIRVLGDEIKKCDIVLAIIGPEWLGLDERGGRRIDNLSDFVRIEIEAAFSLGKPVVPILVADARMPEERDLPASLRELAKRQAVFINHERFHVEMDRLMGAISALTEKAASGPRLPDIKPP